MRCPRDLNTQPATIPAGCFYFCDLKRHHETDEMPQEAATFLDDGVRRTSAGGDCLLLNQRKLHDSA